MHDMARWGSYGIYVNGIGNLIIIDEGENPHTVVPWNSWVFTTLATCINNGIQVLETPQGRAALFKLGNLVVQEWEKEGRWVFGGYLAKMTYYVDHFLTAVRRDFPFVKLQRIDHTTLAETVRLNRSEDSDMLWWDGDLENYQPKLAARMSFQRTIILQLAQAADLANRPAKSASEARKVSQHYKSLLFRISMAVAHELAHFFVAYLAQRDTPDMANYTPTNVTVLNHGVFDNVQDFTARSGSSSSDHSDDWWVSGESGSWMENELFGGLIEALYDPQVPELDPERPIGVLYRLDTNENLRKVSWDSIRAFVEEPKNFHFPLQCEGPVHSVSDLGLRLKGLSFQTGTGRDSGLPMIVRPLKSIIMERMQARRYRTVKRYSQTPSTGSKILSRFTGSSLGGKSISPANDRSVRSKSKKSATRRSLRIWLTKQARYKKGSN